MSNDIVVPDNFGQVADVFKESPVDASRFTAGIGMAWPILLLRGKNWGWRFRGQEQQYTAANPVAGGAIMPVQHLDVVIVDAAARLSKVFYLEGYNPGERTNPDCWSADGITPDAGAPKPQSPTCRGCDHNVFGTGAEGKGKACSDNKRLAVVTVTDLKNTDFGGPFMLRLPPGSFANYATYCSVMAARGFQPYQIVTRMMFDPSVSHPKVTFYPVRPLSSDEAVIVIAHQKNPRTGEMLNDKAMAAFADTDAMEGAASAAPTSLAPPPATPPTAAVPPAAKPATNGADPSPLPSHLNRLPTEPVKLTPEQQEIADLKAKLAAAEKVEAEPAPAPVLTPEQLEIQALKAKLAEAETAKKTRGRPRSKPVAPPEGVVTPPSNGVAATANENPPSAIGNQIADRIAGIVGKN